VSATDYATLTALAERLGRSRAEGGVGPGNRWGFGGWRAPLERHELAFTGEEGAEWLRAQAKQVPLGGRAATPQAVGRALLDAQLVHDVSGATAPFVEGGAVFRLQADEVRLSPGARAPLNCAVVSPTPARGAAAVAADLRTRILALHDAFLTEDGRGIDYARMRESEAFSAYLAVAAELQRVDLLPLSKPERTAFFINVYNVLVAHAVAVLGFPTSLLERLAFFSSVRYRIGGVDYTPDDIENGILRGNRPSAASIGALLGMPSLSKGPFARGDPRLLLVVAPGEPRIHFALNCAAASCPPIRLYSADSLDAALDAAASAFCETEVVVNASERTVEMSKIFEWYAPDFGADNDERLRFLLPYLAPAPRAALSDMLKTDPSTIEVKFKPYSWDVNDVSKA